MSLADNSLNFIAGKLLASKFQLPEIPVLQPIASDDSLGGSFLWRWGTDRVLRATSFQKVRNECLNLSWDLLHVCQNILGIPRKAHPRPAWEFEGYHWTLLDWLPGEPWNPWEQNVNNFFENATALLGMIHERSRSALGATNGLLPCVIRRRELAASLPGWLGRFQLEREPPEVVTKLAACLENRVNEFTRLVGILPGSGPLIVVHGDARPSNFIVGPRNAMGLTDFNNCRVDHPTSDLARLLSGLPGIPGADALTVDLARTNRWGSMAQWLDQWLEWRSMNKPIEKRINELVKLDWLDK